MDNAQIPQTRITKLPPPGAGPVTVLSDEEIASVKAIDPDITLSTLSNDNRAKVKAFITSLQTPVEVLPEAKRGGWTEERKAEASRKAKERYAKKQEG